MSSLISFTVLLVTAFISDASCQRGPLILPLSTSTIRPRPLTRPQWLWEGYTSTPANSGHVLPAQQNGRHARNVESPSEENYGHSASDIVRTVREVNDEPQWLWKGDVPRAPATGDHPYLPPHIDDVKLDQNRRYARSVDSPSAKGYGRSSSGHRGGDTGATHPGYNRRNARSIRIPDWNEPIGPMRPFDPIRPRPGHERPFPIYVRNARDIQFPGVKKPTHRDVIIPNWNPHVKTNPWNKIRVKV